MRKVYLLILICGCHCLAQNPGISGRGASSNPWDMPRGAEVGGPLGPLTPVATVIDQPNSPSPGIISLARLRHKVPKAAQKAYRKGTKLFHSGKYLEASKELERAVALDPEYAGAHNNLGVQYAILSRFADAHREFLRAIDLDPALASANLNAARVELLKSDLASAEQHARRASMLLSGQSDQAQLLLNSILARSGR